MKKIWALLVGGLMMMSCLVACGGEEPEKKPDDGVVPNGTIDTSAKKETVPDYLDSDDLVYNIGMWVGIPGYKPIVSNGKVTRGEWTDAEYEEQYDFAAKAGITIAVHSDVSGWTQDQNDAARERALDAAEKAGLRLLVWDGRVNTILLNTGIPDTDAQRDARRILAEYADHPAFLGSMITDEPQNREFAALGVGARRYKAIYPDKMYYLNLFPAAANLTQLDTTSYDAYLRNYVDTCDLDYLCYDHYPLMSDGNGGSRLLDDFLYNMEVAQKYALTDDREVWTFLQSMGYSNKKDPSCEEDFRSQVGASLAMGLRGIQWFCWYSTDGGTERFDPAIINFDGTKTAKYDLLKTVNNEVLAFDHVYLRFDWKREMTFVGSENAKGKNEAFAYLETTNTHDRIAGFASTRDTIVGVFEDADGRDGFLVANYDAPTSSATDKVEVSFNNCTRVICYVNGAKTELEVKNGKVVLELSASDYAFLIPLNI